MAADEDVLCRTPLIAVVIVFTCESLAVIFYSEDVETKETTVELQQIIKHTFRTTTDSKAIRFPSLFKIINFDGIENGGG